ncbi:hypothetical protein J0H58_36740 [bacterium]|nr:hypothetical protein [bacterium]
MTDSPVFAGEFREWMDTATPVKWAADLTRDQLVTVLWAVWELGGRAQVILDCLGRHEDELFPGYGYPRARLGLQVLQRMVRGERPTWDEVAPLVDRAVAEMECWPAKLQQAEPRAAADGRPGSDS